MEGGLTNAANDAEDDGNDDVLTWHERSFETAFTSFTIFLLEPWAETKTPLKIKERSFI